MSSAVLKTTFMRLPGYLQALIFSAVVVTAIIVVLAVVNRELVDQPGYGPITSLFRSNDAVAAARAAHEHEQAVAAAYHADWNFVQNVGIKYPNVLCPNPAKWAALSAVEKARWHSFFAGLKQKPVGDSVSCYDP